MEERVINGKGVQIMTRERTKVCEVADTRLVDRLAREPEYSCVRCGAKAHDKASVCEPKLLEPDH